MESIETLKKKLAECKKDGKEKAGILNKLAEAYLETSPAKVIEYGNQALELSQKLDYIKGKAQALKIIGVGNYYLSKYDKSLEYYLNSLKLMEDIRDKEGISNLLNNIGIVYWRLSNFDKALEIYTESLKIMKELENKEGISRVLNNIGLIYMTLENYEKALEYFLKSLEIEEKLENKNNIAYCLNNIGIIYWYLKDYKKSLEYYLESLKINEEINNKYGIAGSIKNIGGTYLQLKDYDKSYEYLQKGLNLAKEIEAKDIIQNIYATLIDLYYKKEDYKKALEYYKLYSETKDTIFTEESSTKIAEMQTKYETEKKEKEAEIYRLKNIELAKANEDIQNKNKELETHREYINLINKILRHDLTNNFSVIKSALRLYQDSKDEQYIDELNKSIKKSIELIKNIRDLEKFFSSHGNLKLYYLTDILDEILINYPSINFHIQGKGKVLADEALSSVFDNLLRNAIIHGKATKIDISIAKKNNSCEIKIADNGIGIPDKIKKKIFNEDFVYGKAGHTGLGLYIVKKAMESYGGSVSIEDNYPEGIVFVLKFRKVR